MSGPGMEVTFWGVRGAVPAPGAATVRYGGNTACVSVRMDDGSLLIFDCGTGARNLGHELMQGDFGKGKGQATVAIALPQWDHIQGFPFFRPFYVSGNQFEIFGRGPDGGDLQAVLEFQMAAQYFPVQTTKNMAGGLKISALQIGQEARVGGGRLSAVPSHKGANAAVAYRLQSGDKAIVYAGHAEYPDGGPGEDSLKLFAGADLLIHECTFTAPDAARYQERGLASASQAVETACQTGVKHLALFHYDQDYTDHQIDTLVADARRLADAKGTGLKVTAAAEGLSLTI